MDDLEDIHDLKDNVKNSDNFVLLITEGVFERRFVLEEVTTALSLNKNIILIWDKERCPWPEVERIPQNTRTVLLNRAIIWNAEKAFREVVLKQIVEKMTKRSLKKIEDKKKSTILTSIHYDSGMGFIPQREKDGNCSM